MKKTKAYKLLVVTTGIFLVSIVSMSIITKMEPIHINNTSSIVIASFEDKHYETAISSINIEGLNDLDLLEDDDRYVEEKEQNINRDRREDQNQNQDEQVKKPSYDESINKDVPAPKEQDSSNLVGYLNSYVLDVIKTYNGRYPYVLNQDYENYNGVTTTLYYEDKVLLKAHPSGNRASHCSGITFEVLFKAMQIRNAQLGIHKENFNGMNYDQLFDFILHWYAAQGPKSQSNITVAVEKYGIGRAIRNLEDARPGDFIDFSRENGTGHTAVFLNWVREGNTIIGFRYWSSQSSTGGIAYNTEYFNVRRSDGKKYGNVIINQLYIARIVPVNQYKKDF